MKITCVLMLIVINSLVCYSQTKYATQGAEWYYTVTNSGGNIFYNYERYFVEKDTLIEGKTCKIIKSQNFKEVMYEENNKVYYYFRNKFRLIYDFGVSIGDTVSFDFKSYSPQSMVYDTTFSVKCVVDKIDTIMVNNKPLRRISSSVIPIEELFYLIWYNEYTYIERVGFLSNFMCTLEHPSIDNPHTLRCYNDLDINYSTDSWKVENKPCDYSLLTSNLSITKSINIDVYPNPVVNEIIVITKNNDLSSYYNFILFDNKGKIVINKIFQTTINKINVSQLAKGIYYILIYNNHFLSNTYKIIKI